MRLSRFYLLCSIALAVCLTGAFIASQTSQAAESGQQTKKAIIHGFDPSNLDRSVQACKDFFHFADGGWIKNNPIPAAYSRWGHFETLGDQNQQIVHQILEDAARNTTAPRGSNEQKIGAFYAACMNTEQIEAEGTKSLTPEFERIHAVKNVKELSEEIGHLQSEGIGVLFGFGAGQDPHNSNDVILNARQGGTTL